MNSSIFGGAYVGSVIDGQFPLVRCLGGTANSSVFLTQLAGDADQKASIKLLRASGLDADACLTQWNQTMELSHPHLVRMLAAGRCQVGGEDALYAVMEYADEVLAEVLPERALTPDEVSDMLPPILDALGWLHAHGLVHNRVKPTNLLAVDDKLKLSVDGIQAAGSTRQRALTSAYDAPEVAAGSVSAASDVWALGVTVVETLTQRTLDWMRTTGTDPVIPASLPQPFLEIAQRCLRADPAGRFTIAEIQNILSPSGAAVSVPPPAQPRAADSGAKKRRMQLWVLGAAAVALLAIVVGTKLNAPHSERQDAPE
ncbi:MAG TPA: protein kinase, partial [Terracidiphilus sp.]|nr:protein kinase [Terracidiphilus sp.]